MEAALAEHCFDTLFETTTTVTYHKAVPLSTLIIAS